jgi:hypothetical protein
MGILMSPQYKLERAPVNPLDKSTIISIFPKQIDEYKHTLQPGRFIIPPGSYEKPSVLVIGPSSWWKEIDPEQPHIEIPQSSVVIANSVVNDYCNGLVGCDMGEKMPGLFWLPGEINPAQLVVNHKVLLDRANTRQRNWLMELVKIADVLWARTNGNPLSISNDMRMAAEMLNLKVKPWMQDFTMVQLTNCPACGHLRNNNYPICANCKTVIDKAQFEKLGLKFAS